MNLTDLVLWGAAPQTTLVPPTLSAAVDLLSPRK